MAPTQARSEDSPASHPRSLMSSAHQHTPSGNPSSDLGCFNFAVLELQLSGTIQHVLFVHLTSFTSAVSVRLSGLWHRDGSLPFPLTCETHHILQTYPVQHREAPSLFPVWGYYEHSCCEHICTSPWWTCTLISRACIFRNETARSQHKQRFNFSNYCQTIFQSACTNLHCYQLSMIFK